MAGSTHGSVRRLPGRRPSARFGLAFVAFGLLALGFALSALAQEPKVSLKLSPDGPVGLDEYLQLSVTVEGQRNQVGLPDFRLENLAVVSGPSQNTSFQFINGVSSQSVTFTWIVQAQTLGEARVHSGSMRLGERLVELPPANARAVEDPPERARNRRGGNDPFDRRLSRDPFDSIFGSPLERRRRPRAREPIEPPRVFLEAEISPRRPYVGQQALYTLYLYTDVTVRSVTPTRLPDFKGFWTQVIPQPQDPDPEWVVRDNREIGRVILLQRALFPRRAGQLEIEPIEATMTAMVRDASSFGNFFPQLRETQRDSNPVTVDVRPLPEGAPDGFRDAVGRIEIAATLEPARLEAGEAATLTLELTGEGHLQGLLEPSLPEIADVEVFPPQQQSEESLRGTRVRGKRVWSYVVVPRRPGTVDIDPIRVPYFDPRAGEYRVASTDALQLEVTGNTKIARGSGSDVELHGIRTGSLPSPSLAGGGDRLWRHLLLWAPLLLALGIARWRNGSEALGARPRDAGRAAGPWPGRAGRRAARQRLARSLQEAVAESRPRPAAALVEDAWRAYLVERWQIPPGTASTQWSKLLEERGAPREAAEELVRLADDLHYLRYAPKLSSTDELRRELVDRSRRLAKKL